MLRLCVIKILWQAELFYLFQRPQAMHNKNRLLLLLQPNHTSTPMCPEMTQNEPCSLFSCSHLIEYMETPFSRIPHDDT